MKVIERNLGVLEVLPDPFLAGRAHVRVLALLPQSVKEINEEGRAAGARLIRETSASGGQAKAFMYVNNRFEGNALQTIAAMI